MAVACTGLHGSEGGLFGAIADAGCGDAGAWEFGENVVVELERVAPELLPVGAVGDEDLAGVEGGPCGKSGCPWSLWAVQGLEYNVSTEPVKPCS